MRAHIWALPHGHVTICWEFVPGLPVRIEGQQPGERLAVIAQLLKEGEIVQLHHRSFPGMRDEIELLRVFDRQQFQQRHINQAEDGDNPQAVVHAIEQVLNAVVKGTSLDQ